MSAYLIDTNVISELAKPSPSRRVVAFMASQDAPFLSIITLHELTYGVERLPAGSQGQADLRAVLDRFLALFEDRFLAATEQVARAAGLARAHAARAGIPVGMADALIAGTAMVHGLTVATRNVRDFAPLGVPTFDPWKAHH